MDSRYISPSIMYVLVVYTGPTAHKHVRKLASIMITQFPCRPFWDRQLHWKFLSLSSLSVPSPPPSPACLMMSKNICPIKNTHWPIVISMMAVDVTSLPGMLASKAKVHWTKWIYRSTKKRYTVIVSERVHQVKSVRNASLLFFPRLMLYQKMKYSNNFQSS